MYEVTDKTIKYFRSRILSQASHLYSNFLWRTTNNSYHALVVEIFLQRTKAEQVLPVFIHFSDQYKTPESFLNNCKENLFKSLGLPDRNRSLVKLSELLVNQPIPEEKHLLKKLPGVGDYVASAFRSFHLRKRDVLIDSNIVRCYGRFFGFPTDEKTRRQKEFHILSNRITPQRSFKKFNYGILDFTRKICLPQKPQCRNCNLKRKCQFFLTNPKTSN